MATTLNAGTATGGAAISADTSGVLALQSGSTPTTAVTIDTSQNVGIGTSSPNTKFTVNGNANLTGNLYTPDYGYIGNSGGTFSGINTGFQTLSGGSGYLLAFTNGNERMRIDSSGNVGIGTSSPATKFQVSGTSGSLNARINAGNTGLDVTNNDATGVVNLATSPLSVGSKVMSFTTYNGSSSAEAMRIDSSGNFIVGNTVVPDATHAGVSLQSPNVTYSRSATSISAGTTIYHWGFINPNGLVGHIETVNSQTNYVTSSDYRLKENVAPIQNALERVAKLKPCTYTWKIDGVYGEGFIAHELQEVVPIAVSGTKDQIEEDGSIKPQGIDPSKVVGLLTAAIQEQQALIQSLTTRLSALENKQVQAQIGALKGTE